MHFKFLLSSLSLFFFSFSLFAQTAQTNPPATNSPAATTVQPQVLAAPITLIIGDAKLKVTPETQSSAKSQLIDLAFKDIINKEIKNLNGDAAEFWKHYQMNFSETQTPPFVPSYLIKSFSRSPSEPDLMFLSLEAKVDRALFQNLYQQVMTIPTDKKGKSYYLKADYELINCIWSDLGVATREDFTKVVEEHWLKWLRESDERFKTMEMWQNSGSKDSIIINITLKIKKGFYESKIVPGMNLEYSGTVKVLSGEEKVLTGAKVEPQNQFYSTAVKNGLSSTIANYVYRLPLAQVAKIKNEIGNSQNLEHAQPISLHQFQAMDQVFTFLDAVKEKGNMMQLTPELERINNQEALVTLKYTGDANQLGQLLKGLNHQFFKQSPQNPYEFYYQAQQQGGKI